MPLDRERVAARLSGVPGLAAFLPPPRAVPSTPPPPKSTVLVLGQNAQIPVLLGMLMELEGFRALYPAADESAEAAVARRTPDLVVLDVDHPAAVGDAFLGAAARMGVPVVLFSAQRDVRELREHATRRGLTWFGLPIERPVLGSVLASLLRPRPQEGR